MPISKTWKIPQVKQCEIQRRMSKVTKTDTQSKYRGFILIVKWGFFCFVFFCNGELKIFFFQIIQKEEYCTIHNFEMNLNCLKTGIVNSLSYNLSDMKRNTEKNYILKNWKMTISGNFILYAYYLAPRWIIWSWSFWES